MFASFLAVFLVNNSLSGRWLFLASRLTIVSLDITVANIKKANRINQPGRFSKSLEHFIYYDLC